MTNVREIRRAFISYSRQDREFADRLAIDLRANDIEVWVDFEGLEPGTSDWETELRDAIDESFAVLLIASPDSRVSPYVKSELLLAEAKSLPLYALWAKGDHWIDSIPMRLASMQYQDFRGAAYGDGFARLLRDLRKFGTSLKRHFLYESFYTKVLPGDPKPRGSTRLGSVTKGSLSYEVFSKKAIPNALEIRFQDPFRALEQSSTLDTIFMRPSAFKMGAHLLDELFVNYLFDRYPPFSYGENWHLRREEDGAARLAMDWRMFHALDHNDAATMLDGRPEQYGLVAGSTWDVADGKPSYTVVFGAHDRWLLNAALGSPKGVVELVAECMKEVSAAEFDRAHCPMTAVATDFMLARFLQNKLFIQTKECPAHLKRRWDY